MTRRVTVSLPDDLYERLRALAVDIESSVSAQLRRAARLLLRGDGPSGEVGFDPAEWRLTGIKEDVELRAARVLVSNARSKDRAKGAHVVTAADSALFVLPDGVTSGLKRSRLISQALADLQDSSAVVDPLAYVFGTLAAAGATELHLTDLEEVRLRGE